MDENSQLQETRVCIVGVGLMGGSLALALRPFLSHLTLVDTNPATVAAARDLADEITADVTAGVRHADLVILATPVRTILHLLARLPHLRPGGCMVLDIGSTKAEICRAMAALPPAFQAIGGHPMCGKETAGFAAAMPDLYRDQTFILCRNRRTTPAVEKTARHLISLLGARALLLPPETHDTLVAVASHLPYLLAATLMQTAAATDAEELWAVTASGFRDTARLSGSDPRMMLDILLTNRPAILAQLERCQEQLTAVARMLAAADEATIQQWLTTVAQQHAAYRKRKT